MEAGSYAQVVKDAYPAYTIEERFQLLISANR